VDIDRNTIHGFAERTRKNLRFIVAAYENGEDVHTVTQLINSLLGLIVYPYEYYDLDQLNRIPLSTIYQDECPWDFSPVKTIVEQEFPAPTSLGELVRHLRNGIAHRRVRFGSTSRDLNEVDVVFWDGRPDKPPNWCATINALDLERFTEDLALTIAKNQ
jgi:hypothetical protein